MARPLALQQRADLRAALLAEIKAEDGAAWVVDLGRGTIVAANDAGAGVFGLSQMADPDAAAFILDASMPALLRLRQLARERSGSANRQPLVFWTPKGAFNLLARLRFVTRDSESMAVVVSENDQGDVAETRQNSVALFERNRQLSDNEAKLEEMARRIREAQIARKEDGSVDATDAPQEIRQKDPPKEESALQRASLAHELRTPVSAIAAAAEIMKDQRFGPVGDERYIGYAADIHASAQHVLGVIERMLAEAHAVNASQTAGLDFVEVDVSAFLEASVSQVAPLAERAGLTLSLDLPTGLPHLVADMTSLRQIVFNLLTNALKFTDRGGAVTVSARSDLDGPLSISIADTGPGMSPREIAQAFASLSLPNLGGERSSARSGLGLGLPLVRNLTQANGGGLEIESAPGQGTKISLVFPKDRVIPV